MLIVDLFKHLAVSLVCLHSPHLGRHQQYTVTTVIVTTQTRKYQQTNSSASGKLDKADYIVEVYNVTQHFYS